MGAMVGDFRIQPSEVMEMDADDFEFWLERLEEHAERTQKRYGNASRKH